MTLLLGISVSGAVIELTDETFEHQTQASTGQVSFIVGTPNDVLRKTYFVHRYI